MPNFRKQRIAGRIVRSLVVLLVLAANALILWRVFFSANIPDAIDTLSVNDSVLAAYAAHGDELQLLYQDQPSVTRSEKDRGYFAVPECVFLPEADQVQVVFRYNNSTLSHLATDYALPEVPAREQHLFDVSLVRTTVIEGQTDEDGTPATEKERYHPTGDAVCEYTTLYTFYRYVFEGVTVEDLTEGIFVDVYYVEDIDYEKEAYGRLCIYSQGEEWLSHKLTADDKKALQSN